MSTDRMVRKLIQDALAYGRRFRMAEEKILADLERHIREERRRIAARREIEEDECINRFVSKAIRQAWEMGREDDQEK